MVDQHDATVSGAHAAKSRAPWVKIVRAAIGLGLLLTLLLWNDNAAKLLGVARDFEPKYLVALFLIAFGLNALSSLKWSLFVRERGFDISQVQLFNLYLIGKFFSNFLPSMVGGDLARIYLLGRAISSHSRSFASVFLERATGVVGLTLLTILFGLLNPEMLTNPFIALSIAAAAMACAIAVVLFYRPSLLFRICGPVADVPLLGKVVSKGERVIREVTYFRHHQRLLLLSMLYSLGFHLLAGVNVYVACLSIGLVPPLLDILVLTPVILLLVMIPVSPNNIGWWEWCFSVLLIEAGATAVEGLVVALVLRAVTMAMSVIGGLLFLQYRLGHATS